MAYREPGPGPEPPRRGVWCDKCPHGFLAKWQWVCRECNPAPTVRPRWFDYYWTPHIVLCIVAAVLFVIGYLVHPR